MRFEENAYTCFSVKGGIGTNLEGDTHDEDQKKICPGTQRQS